MGWSRTDNGLVGPDQVGQGRAVGTGAVEDIEDINITSEEPVKGPVRLCGHFIVTVARGMPAVDPGQGLHEAGMDTRTIIAFKAFLKLKHRSDGPPLGQIRIDCRNAFAGQGMKQSQDGCQDIDQARNQENQVLNIGHL